MNIGRLAFLIKAINAKMRPAVTPIIKSPITVSRKVTTSTSESAFFTFKILINSFLSLIFQATNIKIGAIAASGIIDAYGANTIKISKTTTPCTTPEIGLAPPFYVRCRSGNSSRRWNSSEKRCRHIGNSLPHKLFIAVMLRAFHIISDHCG